MAHYNSNSKKNQLTIHKDEHKSSVRFSSPQLSPSKPNRSKPDHTSPSLPPLKPLNRLNKTDKSRSFHVGIGDQLANDDEDEDEDELHNFNLNKFESNKKRRKSAKTFIDKQKDFKLKYERAKKK
eukprot:793678_1